DFGMGYTQTKKSNNFGIGIPVGIGFNIYTDSVDNHVDVFQPDIDAEALSDINFTRVMLCLSPSLKYIFHIDKENSIGLILKCTFPIANVDPAAFKPFFLGGGIILHYR